MANKPININKNLTLVYFNNLILKELKKNGVNCWIAGGVLRDYFSNKPLIVSTHLLRLFAIFDSFIHKVIYLFLIGFITITIRLVRQTDIL